MQLKTWINYFGKDKELILPNTYVQLKIHFDKVKMFNDNKQLI